MTYPVAFKDEIVKKVLSTERKDSILTISKQACITTRTIRRWVRMYQEQLPLNAYLSDTRKTKAVLDTINTGASEKSVFCRSNGILPEDLHEWELDLKKSLIGGAVSKFEYKKLKAEKEELEKQLVAKEKALAVKDKALAESAALLELQKKVQILLEKEGLNLNQS